MSRELSELYGSLAADADARDLGLPDVLRHQADRRARFRAAGSTLAVGLVVVGVVIGAQVVTTPPASVPAPAGMPTPSTSPSPSATGGSPSPSVPPTTPGRSPGTTSPGATGTQPSRTPTSIPDRAFFALAPTNQVGIAPEFRDEAVLPNLCGADIGGEAIVQRRTRLLIYKLPQTPKGYVPDGSYTHSITIYRAGRADDVLKELRQAVRDCPEQNGSSSGSSVRSRQRLLSDSGFGDESVLFEMRNAGQDVNGTPTGADEVRLIRAIRVGDVVTILWEQGWEGTSSQRAQVDADGRRAVAAIRRWLG
ncbi:hypothetical protein [Micromonospora saelicesensis]|uniref:Uncharacterized protein n=1 Tax=Micromonospora saelicesensis TaxID=285676 RepID=A0A1C4ZLQ3_9ACTN|nr:hypothetical protein [Micromonospora saelicesensis]RAO62700.1 hypothetical protein LUPAC06_00314 [Micromonospora saelicesensis]SCF33701.1 hypothetical protein GA0070561_5520 [Micromonospora saelicesensis]